MVAIAVVIGVVVSQRTPPPPTQQIAQVMKSPEPVNTPTAPPVAEPAQTRQRVAPRLAAPPPPAPPPEVRKDENAVAAQADQLQKTKPQAATGAVREFAAARVQNETVTVTQTIGPVEFTYAVGADGFLQIVAVETGFVSVTAEFTDRDDVIYPSSEVAAKATIRIQIPADATGLIIGYSKMSGVNDSRIGRPLVPGLGFDPNPPNGRFRIQVPVTVITPPSLTPATR
jgi:type IV secretory pathway VirB10-like protein